MSLRNGLSILFERHAQALLGSLGRLARQPLATLLTVLVIGIALAKILFGRGERLWAALLMPALVMAVTLTSTRTAWVGVCAAAAVLLRKRPD